jgi:hypothetical protein
MAPVTMTLYHYSVDSYQSGGKLINDFKKQFRFAEPFMLALQKSEECFWGAYFAAMSYSRELCALGLRKHENYIKDAVEGIFEYVRRRDYPDSSASRVGCVYYCESKEEALRYLKDDCIDNGDFTVDQVKLLEVEVDATTVFRYDQTFFNDAVDIMEESRDLARVMALAGRYYSGERSDNPLIEILADGENRIIAEIPTLFD